MSNVDNIIKKFLEFFHHNQIDLKSKFLVAVSGGLDSMSVLDLSNRCGLEISVAHINYGLRGEENIIEKKLVEIYCKNKNIKYYNKDAQINSSENLQNEARKIMGLHNFKASVTCVRVPVFRAHSIAVSAEFEKDVSVLEAKKAIESAPGIDLIDDVLNCKYPLPIDVAGLDNCKAGRIRKDCTLSNGLSFWVVGDQLLKGAALNAVQIAEEVAKL